MSQAAFHSSALPVREIDREQALHERVWRQTRLQSRYEHTGVAIGRALFIGVVLLLWGYASGRWIDHQAISDPVSVLQALYHLIETGRLWPDLGQTVLEVAAGYGFGALAAVLVALLFALLPSLEQAMRPILISIYSIPKVALAPLFVIWMGTGTEPKVAIALMLAIFPIVIDMVLGLRSVDPDMLALARVSKASPMAVLFKIRFPCALPSLFAGMKVAVSFALVGAIVGEFVAGSKGLGFQILTAQGQFDTVRVFVSLVLLGIAGTLLFFLVDYVERLLLPWHVSQRGRAEPAGHS